MMSDKIHIMNEAMKKRRASGALRADKITTYYFDEYDAHKDDAAPLREAWAHKNLYENIPVYLFPDELIYGHVSVNEPVYFHYSCGTAVNMNLAREYAKQEKMDPEETQAFLGRIESLDAYRYIPWEEGVFTEEEKRSMTSTVSTTTFFGGHMIPDYEGILTKGLGGYQVLLTKKIIEGGNDLHKAMLIMLRAIQTLIGRYAEKAASMSMDAGGLYHIVSDPPRTFREGIQLVWFIHMLNGRDSFGRFDRYLYPLYKKDTESGIISEQEVHELVSALCIKTEEVGDIQNLTLGGTDEDLNDTYNGLTLHMIDSAAELGYKGPNLCLRVTETMPDSVWNAAMRCIGTGIGLPALYNDKIYYENYIRYGCDRTVAWDYCFGGCSQIMLSGRSCYINDIGAMNILKVLEITLGKGSDLKGERILSDAPDTVPSTYEEFSDHFYQVLDRFIDLEVSVNNKDIAHRARHEGYVMRSLFTRGCIENGKTVFCGGAEYNGVELEVMGITNTADSLYAIRKTVFEDKRFTLDELTDILRSDWRDRENVRLYMKNLPKFGNDNNETDSIRAELSDFIFSRLSSHKGINGGNYIPGEVIFTAHHWMGEACAASADGRRSGEVLADSCGATQGADVNGPTALFNSVLKIPSSYLLTTLVLNVKFTKNLWQDTQAEDKIRLMFEIFFKRGGMQLQVNVCDSETLKQARIEPEKYRSLVVRVGGYSDYFVNLPSQLQDEIITRTESTV